MSAHDATNGDRHNADPVRKEDLRVEIFRHPSTFPGPSMVRLTHLPTGIVVTSDEHSSGLKAKEQAIARLREQLALNDGGDVNKERT